MPFEYTDTKLEWSPTGSTWAAVLQSGVSRGNSPWALITASTPAAWILAAIVVGDWTIGVTPGDWEIDVGVGPAASEVVICTFPGIAQNANDAFHHIFLPIPVDAIPAGSRVSVRLRAEGTSTFTWRVAIGYYTKPISGSIATYTGIPSVSTPAAASPSQTSGASWANVPYTTIENAPSDVCIGGAVIYGGQADTEMEVDLAQGGAGSEVIFATLRKNMQSSQFALSHFQMFPILFDGVTSGTRIAFRARTGTATPNTTEVKLLYYPKPVSANRKTTSAPIVSLPSAADGIGPTSATSWAAGAYTQLIASTSGGAMQLIGVSMDKDFSANADENECDIAIGSVGNEVVIATYRFTNQQALRGGGMMFTPPVPMDSIPNGSRIAVRVRNSGATDNAAVRLAIIAYQGLSGAISQTSKILKSLPAAANGISVVPTAGDWTDGAWAQCTPSMSNDSLIAGLGIFLGSANGELGRFEIDIGFGPGGTEVVATTLRGNNFQYDFGKYFLPTGLRCPQGTRVSFRVRKMITGTNNNLKVALMYYDNVNFTGGPPPSHGAPPIGVVTVLLGNVIYATPARAINIEYSTTGAAILEGSLDGETFITLDTAGGAGLRTVVGVVAPFIRPSVDITVVFRKSKAKL